MTSRMSLMLISFLALISWAFVSVACCSAFAQPDFLPEQHLARGHFHSAVFSRDGKRLLTAAGSLAQLWEVETGKPIRQIDGHQASIHSVCFSPDEQRILTGAGNAGLFGPEDPTARLWDAATGKQLAVFEGPGKYVPSAQFSPDGKQILTVFVDVSLTVGDTAIFWNAKTGRKHFVLSGISFYSPATAQLESVKFSPMGNAVAGMLSGGKQIRLWDAKTGEVVWQIQGAPYGPKQADRRTFGSIEFSADEKFLLAACSDKTAKLWDVCMRREMRAFEGHAGDIVGARFCFDGEKVMTVSQDGSARLWDTRSGREVKQFRHAGPIRDMALGKDGMHMITIWIKRKEYGADDDVQWFASLWDVKTSREIKQFDLPSLTHGPYPPIVFSPDGRHILANLKSENVVLLDAATGEIIRSYK